MMTHKSVWNGIDRLAKRHGLSPSGLARRAGLDATSFNKSKRIGPGGKPRWPTLESMARILAATGDSMESFVQLMEGKRVGLKRRIPMLDVKLAGESGYFDEAGYPVGDRWEQISAPDLSADDIFTLRVSDDQMAPVYRKGDVIFVAPNADLKPGDRVVVRARNGDVMIRELVQQNSRQIILRSFGRSTRERAVNPKDILWIARIIWTAQ